jgi:putative nucleotide binding protein
MREQFTSRNKKFEEFVMVLDFLPLGRLGKKPSYLQEPLIQVVGEKYFTLLELTTTKDANINLHDRFNINPRAKRKDAKVLHVKRRINIEDLTITAQRELPFAIEKIVTMQENRFVTFFNEAKPITTRRHQLELLPGVGKKFVIELLNERKKGPFKSFNEIEERTRIHPKKVIEKRILLEIEGNEKRYLFARPPITGG